jgi:hypothetical protein
MGCVRTSGQRSRSASKFRKFSSSMRRPKATSPCSTSRNGRVRSAGSRRSSRIVRDSRSSSSMQIAACRCATPTGGAFRPASTSSARQSVASPTPRTSAPDVRRLHGSSRDRKEGPAGGVRAGRRLVSQRRPDAPRCSRLLLSHRPRRRHFPLEGRSELELTPTFKQRTSASEAPYDPAACPDPLYVHLPERDGYVALDAAICARIHGGSIRL